MLCSIIIPTRGRVEKLKRCLDSFRKATISPTRMEFLLYVDHDDRETIEAIPKLGENVVAFIGKRFGWQNNSKACDIMVAHSRARWLWFMNDDVVMDGYGWDSWLLNEVERPIIIHPEVFKLGHSTYRNAENQAFPMILASWCRSIFNPLPEPLDKHVQDRLAEEGFRTVFMPGVTLWHDREEPKPSNP